MFNNKSLFCLNHSTYNLPIYLSIYIGVDPACFDESLSELVNTTGPALLNSTLDSSAIVGNTIIT